MLPSNTSNSDPETNEKQGYKELVGLKDVSFTLVLAQNSIVSYATFTMNRVKLKTRAWNVTFKVQVPPFFLPQLAHLHVSENLQIVQFRIKITAEYKH